MNPYALLLWKVLTKLPGPLGLGQGRMELTTPAHAGRNHDPLGLPHSDCTRISAFFLQRRNPVDIA